MTRTFSECCTRSSSLKNLEPYVFGREAFFANVYCKHPLMILMCASVPLLNQAGPIARSRFKTLSNSQCSKKRMTATWTTWIECGIEVLMVAFLPMEVAAVLVTVSLTEPIVAASKEAVEGIK